MNFVWKDFHLVNSYFCSH